MNEATPRGRLADRYELLLDLLVLLRLLYFLLTNLVAFAHDQLLLVLPADGVSPRACQPPADGSNKGESYLPSMRKSRGLLQLPSRGATGEVARRPGPLKVEPADPTVAIQDFAGEI